MSDGMTEASRKVPESLGGLGREVEAARQDKHLAEAIKPTKMENIVSRAFHAMTGLVLTHSQVRLIKQLIDHAEGK